MAFLLKSVVAKGIRAFYHLGIEKYYIRSRPNDLTRGLVCKKKPIYDVLVFGQRQFSLLLHNLFQKNLVHCFESSHVLIL